MSTVEGADRHESWSRYGIFEVHDLGTGVKWVWRNGRWVGLPDGEWAQARCCWTQRLTVESASLPPPGGVR